MDKAEKRGLLETWFDMLQRSTKRMEELGGAERLAQLAQLISDMHDLEKIDPCNQERDGPAFAKAKQLHRNICIQFSEARLTAMVGFPNAAAWELMLGYPGPKSEIDGNWRIAMGAVFYLVTMGEIGKIHPCAHCTTLFLRRRLQQSFCTALCRVAHNRASTEGRHKRAIFMKGYRKRLKSRDRKNLAVAKANQGDRVRALRS